MTYTTKLILALSLLLPLTACDLDDLPTSDRAALTTDDDARPDHRRGPPPPVMLLELAIDHGDLQDDATMSEALTAMDTAHTAALAARDGLLQALADAVAANVVTSDDFVSSLAAITRAARIEGTTLTVALDTAHDLLDAELRAEVVDALPEPPRRPEAGQAPPGGPGPMAMLEALALDDDQRQALRDALGEPPRPERPEPLELALFAEDDFEAASLELADLHADHVTEHAKRHVELLVALVPLLDDDQRTTLEGLLREPS